MKIITTILKWFTRLLFILIIGIGFGFALNYFNPNNITIENSEETISKESTDIKDDLKPNIVDLMKPSPTSVDETLIEELIFQSVNELRAKLSINPVTRNESLRLAATVRAIETEESFSHTRPDGTEPFTVLDEPETLYVYSMAGENLAMATFFKDERHMSQLIFEGWVDSEGHYETMVNPEFDEIGIGIHYDGEILYATQFFGKPR